MPTLFDPVRFGDLELKNRILMAPLTRTRSGDERIPGPLVADYYRQRASAGLILTEATSITPEGVGYPRTPGIWSEAQVEGWKRVTEAVHQAGGKIALQLWHVGRISDPIYLDGRPPVAPSAVTPNGHVSLVRPEKGYETPRALERDEIPRVIEDYRKGAENALRAGFDGIELHGANGYLLDQFLQDKTNRRTDDYGGPVENRARLLLEATDAAIDVWGAGRVGVHLAPRADSHDMGDSDLEATFTHVARELGKRRIAFIAAREKLGPDSLGPKLKAAFGGAYVANEGFTGETAQAALDAGWADGVAFGKDFISNPDLPERLRTGAALNPYNSATFYAPGAEGYTDYPALGEREPADA